jgi:hypothetical protein
MDPCKEKQQNLNNRYESFEEVMRGKTRRIINYIF